MPELFQLGCQGGGAVQIADVPPVVREQPGVFKKKKLWSFLIRMWEKECKMQPGQKHFTASSRLFSV